MDISNDPRVFAKNVVMKRLGAFHLISISAVLTSHLCIKQMLAILKQFNNPHTDLVYAMQYGSLVALSLIFILNLISVVIIITQIYHISRMSTAGPHGFEIASSYYLDSCATSLRHAAARNFFFCIPLFIIVLACTVYVQSGGDLGHSLPVCFSMGVVAFLLFIITLKQRAIFLERYNLAREYGKPLRQHLTKLEESQRLLTSSR